jgi:rfaE bifunctional protein nucleotidyltransferase chain/domain
MGEIVEFSTLNAISAEARRRGRTIAQCHGCFDIFHVGHLRHLEEVRRLADVLVVSVTADPFVGKGPGRPAFADQSRMEVLAAMSVVDFVTRSDAPTAEAIIRALRPAVFAKGPDYVDKLATDERLQRELHALDAVGGRLWLTGGSLVSSSTALIGRLDGNGSR